MKALTIWQPWATLIAIGAKPYEFRRWRPYRSLIGTRIAIHASARAIRMSEVFTLYNDLRTPQQLSACLHAGRAIEYIWPLVKAFAEGNPAAIDQIAPRSRILCTAIVGPPKRGDLCALEFGIEAPRKDADRDEDFNWGWPMLEIRPTPPIPLRSKQGLFDIPDDLIAEGGLI
jgi:hypothetical protein